VKGEGGCAVMLFVGSWDVEAGCEKCGSLELGFSAGAEKKQGKCGNKNCLKGRVDGKAGVSVGPKCVGIGWFSVSVGWSPLVTVVDAPPSEWAAWVLGVSPVAGSASFEVGYIRDFSFQFLNLSNLGRPATDGIYKARFVLESSQARLELTSRVSEVVPPKRVRQEPWDPTTEQKQRFGKYMSFEEGSCPAPAGCSK
jgi:hypothetical protein